jgi:hypothetical protein
MFINIIHLTRTVQKNVCLFNTCAIYKNQQSIAYSNLQVLQTSSDFRVTANQELFVECKTPVRGSVLYGLFMRPAYHHVSYPTIYYSKRE